jgi:ClpP class serine protease
MLNTPHLATQATYDSVAEYLDNRNIGMAVAGADKGTPWQASVNNGVAILEINGALTYRASAMEAMCGGMSYETLYSRYMSVVEAGATTVVMQMGSGGGQAVGVFDVSTMIRQHATDNNISLITYVDTICASACFAIGCIADEVIMASDASIGSCGVVIALRNDAEKQKADGITTQYVYSGKNKIGKDAEGQFTEEFLADMQANCDALYERLCEDVAMY